MNRNAGAAVWALVSQALTTLSNFLVVILVARVEDPKTFGFWSLCYAVVIFTTAMSRASIATPRVAEVGRENLGGLDLGGLGSAMTLGVMAGVAVALAGIAWSIPASVFIPFVVGLPLVAGQDYCRYEFLACRPLQAVTIDSIWLMVTGALVLAALANGWNALILTSAWVFGAGVSLLVAVRISTRGSSGIYRATRSFVARHRSEIGGLGREATIVGATNLALPLAVAVIAGPSQAGTLRLALTILGPVAMLSAAAIPSLIASVARRPTTPIMRRWAWTMSTIALVYASVLAVVPDDWGHHLLGDPWYAIAPAIGVFALVSVARVPGLAAAVRLRASARTRHLPLVAAMSAPFTVLLPAFGARWADFQGCSVGMLLATLIATGMYVSLGQLQRTRA